MEEKPPPIDLKDDVVDVTRADYLSARKWLHYAAVNGHVRCIRRIVPSIPYEVIASKTNGHRVDVTLRCEGKKEMGRTEIGRFKLLVPSKWNPSKEVEYPGQVLKYEDNGDATTVMVIPTDKKTIKDYGSPAEFLSKVDYLLGKKAYSGKTDAEEASESCYNTIKQSWSEINKIASQSDGLAVLTEKFMTCRVGWCPIFKFHSQGLLSSPSKLHSSQKSFHDSVNVRFTQTPWRGDFKRSPSCDMLAWVGNNWCTCQNLPPLDLVNLHLHRPLGLGGDAAEASERPVDSQVSVKE